MYKTLIAVDDLYRNIDAQEWVIVDCRFQINDTEYGRRNYQHTHILGAVYAHLNEDLSGPVVPGRTGRHPLPDLERITEIFSSMGIREGAQVIAYDDAGGALAAARLWWMLNWLGHTAVAVLDGGWQIWQERGYPTRGGFETKPHRQFTPMLQDNMRASSVEVEVARQDDTCRVFDARTRERFRGENETFDPVAGHIPGAHSAPYAENTRPDNSFLPKAELRLRYEKLLSGISAENAIFYCGSGVTAAHNILAMAHSGLGMGRLYAGSWSEWITDPLHAVEKGD